MERWKRTVVGHKDLLWLGPLGWNAVAPLASAVDLRPGARVLDLCCGKGALLGALCDWVPDASGVGVDRVPEFIEEARGQAREDGLDERVRFEVGDARTWDPRQRGFDVAACVGARPWETTAATLGHLASRVRAGGVVIVGESYWRRPPDPAYLELLGCGADENEDLASTLAAGSSLELDLEHWTVATPEDFDQYERAYLGNFLAHARRHPGDEEAQRLAQGARRWRDAYLRWGRDTLGFVVAAYRVPSSGGRMRA